MFVCGRSDISKTRSALGLAGQGNKQKTQKQRDLVTMCFIQATLISCLCAKARIAFVFQFWLTEAIFLLSLSALEIQVKVLSI